MLLSSPPPPPGEPRKNGVIQKFQKEFPGLVLLWSLSVLCLAAGLGCVSGLVLVGVCVLRVVLVFVGGGDFVSTGSPRAASITLTFFWCFSRQCFFLFAGHIKVVCGELVCRGRYRWCFSCGV